MNPADTRIILPARCKLCGKEFALPTEIYEIGTTEPTAELLHFSQKISAHLTKRHPERVALNFAIYQTYDSYSVLACFALYGPLADQFDRLRHTLHRHTRRVRITDQKLIEKVTGLALLNSKDQESVLALLTEMRDLYEEKGLHPDIEAAEAGGNAAGAQGVVLK